MTETKKPPERLSEWFDAAIIHLLKKQEKLISKIDFTDFNKYHEEINKKIPSTESIMKKIKEFNKHQKREQIKFKWEQIKKWLKKKFADHS